MGTPFWRRVVAGIITAILILEAGAIGPASSVSAAQEGSGTAIREPSNAAPVDPLAEPLVPDATSITCDDFNRTVTDGLGAGALGVWQAWNGGNEPPGMTHVSNGEASLTSHSYGGTIRYLDLGSVPLPFEILIKQRVWMGSPAGSGAFPIDIYFGLSTTPAFSGTIPPADYYLARYLHSGDPAVSRELEYYARARVGGGTGGTTDFNAYTFDPAYGDGTFFYTRLQVFGGDTLFIKHWHATDGEPAAFIEWPITNPSPEEPMRFLVIRNDSVYPLPAQVEGEWRIDELCLDASPPPVLVSEPVPPETEQNHNPNSETSGDPVNTFNGSLTLGGRDVAIAGRGPAIEFQRTYNSNDSRVGPMGPGWTHNYATRLVLADDASGDMYLIGPNGRSDRYTLEPGGTFTPPPGIHAQLVANPDGTFTVLHKDQSSWAFDVGGRLTSIRDRYGNVSTLVYGAGGRLISITDPAGRGSLALAYTNGRLTSLTDWASPARVVTYQYDGTGRLWKVTDREGKTTTFTYDGTSQRIATITDARGNVALTNTYDGQGRVATQKDARGLVTGDSTTYAYVVNPDGTRVTTLTAPPTSFEPAFLPTLIDSYDANGWLVQRQTTPTSTESLTETFTYDADGNRMSVTDARGNRTDFCYDVDFSGAPIAGGAANLTRRIDPPPTVGADRPVELYGHDADNNLIQTVAPKGVPSGPTVTCSTNLSAVASTYVVDFAYDVAGVTLLSMTRRFTDPDTGIQTAITKYEYSDAANPGLVTRIIPPRGNTGPTPDYGFATTFSYFTAGTRAGLLKDATDPIGNKTSYDYDSVGRLISVIDPLGNAIGGVPSEHTALLSWDKEDRLRFQTLPAPTPGGGGLVTEARYDEVGNPVVRIDSNGQVRTFVYDARNSLFQVTESPSPWSDPANPPASVIVTEYAYDAGGSLTRVTRAKGDSQNERAVDYVYDGRGLVRQETQYPAWPATTGSLQTAYTYDANNSRLTLIDPLGRTTTFGYDALDRLTSVNYSDPGTPDGTYAHDQNGNRTSMTDGTGLTTYSFDEANRLVSVTSPGPKTIGYRYDLNGNRTRLIYPSATSVTYVFNSADQLASLTDWASHTVSYTYWPDGLVKTATNPDGSVTTHGYDNARRMVDLVHRNASAAVLARFYYTLDAVGNVTSVANGSLAAQFGRPDGLAGSNGAWSGTYASIDEATPNDADFLASPSGPTSSHYYEVTLSDVEQPYVRTGITVRYRYAKSGNNAGQSINLTVELRQGSTVIASQTHTNIPGVSGSGWQQGTITLTLAQANTITNFADLRIRFRPTGGSGQKRSAQISWAEVQFPSSGDPATQFAYTYDRLERLTAVTGPDGPRSYTYDPVGNRLTKVAGSTTAYTYDRADRITAAGSTAITVDANGNMTSIGADTYVYDQANRMTSATIAGATETYSYDGDGVRFNRQIGANPPIRYVSDPAQGLPVLIDDGTRKYIFGQDLAFTVSGAAMKVYHLDRLGSVRVLTDPAGAITDQYRADEWGVPILHSGSSPQPFGFTGEPIDATGLVYLRARYYDPTLGRFTSRDTWPGSGAAPQTLNRYSYVTNDPTTNTDPSGHCVVDAAADLAFIAYDILSILFGPEKDREDNWTALGLDVGATAFPCVTGAGLLFRGGRKVASAADEVIDPNRLHHIFDNPNKDWGPLLSQFGSQEEAFRAVQAAAQEAVQSQGLSGVVRVQVQVGDEVVEVIGNVIDGVLHPGTFNPL